MDAGSDSRGMETLWVGDGLNTVSSRFHCWGHPWGWVARTKGAGTTQPACVGPSCLEMRTE